MPILTLNIIINSTNTNGLVDGWSWSIVDNGVPSATGFNPPPRVLAATSTTFQVIVTDESSQAPDTLDGFLVMSAKIENPLTGLQGLIGASSPLVWNGASANVFAWLAAQNNAPTKVMSGSSATYTFAVPSAAGSLQNSGAWEATFVIVNRSNGNQFEIDPEFDVGT